jgi:hypothetical protein
LDCFGFGLVEPCHFDAVFYFADFGGRKDLRCDSEFFVESLEGSFGVGVSCVLGDDSDNQRFIWVGAGFDEAGQTQRIL